MNREKQWRRYIHLIASREGLYGTTLTSTFRDNGGKVYDIEGTASSVITLSNVEVEPLDEEFARQRISSHEGHLRTFDQTNLKVAYRLTLADGQRLIYVQCADCYESFVTHDSHASYDRKS